MKTLRILHCIPTMDGGGAERQLAYLAAALPAFDCQVHVALHRGGVNLARLEQAGAVVHRLRVNGNHDPRLPLQLARTIRRTRPHVVQTWLPQMDVAAGAAALWLRTPWIISERSARANYPDSAKMRLRWRLARSASAIVANSPGGARYWQELPARALLRAVIPNGLPLEEIAAAAPADLRPYGIAPDDRVVIYAGRLSPEKNVPLLIEALAHTRMRNVKAVLCGDGPLRAEIRARVQARGLADVVLLPGYIDNLWSWLARADVLVSIGNFEGHPNAVLEALASGCRVVVSDIDAHRSFLADDLAHFVQPTDTLAVSNAIDTALSLHARNQVAFAARARAFAAQWSLLACAAQYAQLYSTLAVRPERRLPCAAAQ